MSRFAQTLLPKIRSSLVDRSFFAASFRGTKSLLKMPYNWSGAKSLNSWSRRSLPALILSGFCVAAAFSNKDAEETVDENQTVENATVSDDNIDAISLFNEICKIVEETKGAAVKIFCRGKGRSRSGTGFLINKKGFGVTCAHVVDITMIIDVRLPDGRTFNALVFALDRQADLAIFKILEDDEILKGLPILKLAPMQRGTRKGEIILQLGYPARLGLTVSKGIISSDTFSLPSMGKKNIAVNVATLEGSSGGPVINLRGEVIGVLNAGLSIPMKFMIPLEELYALMFWTEYFSP